MVQAIREGEKTMTRRIIKTSTYISKITMETEKSIQKLFFWTNDLGYSFQFAGKKNQKYRIGDRLWVRETWAENKREDGEKIDILENDFLYRADKNNYIFPVKWRPSIFLPRRAARIILEITDIRIERLQDIKEEDTIKEGINKGPDEKRMCDLKDCKYTLDHSQNCGVCIFRTLWEFLNKKRGFGWEKNPWVYVITFKVLTT
jgi:hypothetical protein